MTLQTCIMMPGSLMVKSDCIAGSCDQEMDRLLLQEYAMPWDVANLHSADSLYDMLSVYHERAVDDLVS